MRIESLEELGKVIDLMNKKSVPYLKIGDVEIHRPPVPMLPDVKTQPLKLTPEQQKQVDDAYLFNDPIPTFDQK